MRDHELLEPLHQLGQFLYRFRTPILFGLYLLATMAYAWRWLPY